MRIFLFFLDDLLLVFLALTLVEFRDRLKMPIPTEVIIVIIAILASHFGNFKEAFAVNIVDNVPTG